MRTFALASVLLCAAVFAQQRPTFEAADVHASPPEATESGGLLPDGVEFRATTLLQLIVFAYRVPVDRVVGGPSWLDTDRFDVRAKASGPRRGPVLRAMLASLLTERFDLAITRGEKPVPAYVLTVGRSGVLRESAVEAPSECDITNEDDIRTLTCRNTTIAELIEQLPQFAPAQFTLPIVDRTDLTAAYDFSLQHMSRGQADGTGGDAVLFGAIEKQTGIRVQQQSAPIPVFSIDRVNRTPAPNPPGADGKLGPTPAEFDVADIRPSWPGATGDLKIQNGQIDGRALNLREMIAFAYNVEDDWVRGEKWIESARFDVRAKSAPTVSDDVLRVMARSLLAERFHLKVHTEKQPVEVFALVAAKPKLKTADPSTRATCKSAPAPGIRSYICQNVTLQRLVDRLNQDSGGYLDHQVVDLTGLKGTYDFTLTWTLPFSLPDPHSGKIGYTLFEAINRQLGLKLTPRKHPMPVLVIDHIDRQPTEN